MGRKDQAAAFASKRHKKKPPLPAANKFKQGGVKQSGQEPLNVQKLDDASNERESLIRG
jgi:hypothetical protein